MSLSYAICTQEKRKLEPNFTFFWNILCDFYWKKWYSNSKSILFNEKYLYCYLLYWLPVFGGPFSKFWLLGNSNYTWCNYEFYCIFLIKLWHHYVFHRCKRVHMRIVGNDFWINFEWINFTRSGARSHDLLTTCQVVSRLI